MIERIRRQSRFLANPESAFIAQGKRTFEEVLADYMILLLAVGVLAGLTSFILSVGRSAYLDIFTTITIQYFRMANYALGRAISLVFFYIFAGTFLVFLISVILKPFFRGMKYTAFLKILFSSLSPLLLLSWLPFSQIALFIWGIVIFIIGIQTTMRMTSTTPKVSRRSIQQRD